MIENDTLFSFHLFILQKIVNLEISCPRDKAKKGKNIQIEYKKYVYIFQTSFISEYVIWKWHIFQFDLIYSQEKRQFGDFMSPGQSIKRDQIYKLSTKNMFILPNYHLFLNMWLENDTLLSFLLFILQKIVNLSISCPRDKA